MKTKLIKTEVNYLLKDEQLNVIISTTSLKKEGLSLSLKNCQAIKLGYDLDELAKEYVKISSLEFDAFKSGFQKALEILDDKKFSELALYRAFTTNSAGNEDTIRDRFYNVLLPSLQQTEWDVEVEMKDSIALDGHTIIGTEPKLDADGCLILKRI